jgi:hypothetical protein
MNTNYEIVGGRRTGMTDLRKRLHEVSKLAAEKQCEFHWDDESTHHIIYIQNSKNERLFEERIISIGIELTKKIHAFLDIIEQKLNSL